MQRIPFRVYLGLFLITTINSPVLASFGTPSPPIPHAVPPDPDMPDVSHALLAEHAALSHGLSTDQAEWISQGAWDEDHCSVSIYPPGGPLCVPGIPNGHHSWDPDTNLFWDEPAIWGDFGPGLSHAVMLFGNAVDAYHDGEIHAAYLWLGRAMHMVGDLATPAHSLLDIHLPFDPDSYEDWLSQDDYVNTQAWINHNPPGAEWDMNIHDLPRWDDLDPDLHAEVHAASQLYGGRASGEDLWNLGPVGEDRVIFQLLYLVAEESDNFDSDDFQGELNHGDLSDPVYLTQIRETLFPLLVRHSTVLIAYFEALVLPPPAPALLTPQDDVLITINPPGFTWQAVSFEPTYRIEINNTQDFSSPLVSEAITETSFTPADALQSGTYYWRVQAITTVGAGGWSETWSLIVPKQIFLPLVVE